MIKRIFIIIMIVVLSGFVFAGGQGDSKTDERAPSINLSLSTIASSDASEAKAFNLFALEIQKISHGRIRADVYSGGQIFTQEGEIAAAREGTLDIANYSPSWVAEFVPYLGQLESAYIFSGYDHMRATYSDPGIWERIAKDVADAVGVVPLTALYLGTRELNLVESVGPVRTPQEMKGVNLRTPNSPSWIALGKALGSNPTPMSFGEVYMGLKTGVVEGQDNPLGTDIIEKFYEPTKYIITTDHVVDTIWPSINKDRWDSFSKADQDLILQAWEVARKFNDDIVLTAEKEARAFMEGQGIVFVDDPDKDAFIDYAKNSYQTESKDVSSGWDWDFYDQIQSLRP